jgi:hypothetical protein
MSRPTVLGGGEWPPSSKVEIADYEDGRIVLRDVFLASIFLAYVEPKLFFRFRAGKFSSAAPNHGRHSTPTPATVNMSAKMLCNKAA